MLKGMRNRLKVWLHRSFERMIRLDRCDLAAVVCIMTYSLVFSYFTVFKHHNFSSYAADLGVFTQSFHTTLYDGRLFYYTLEQWINPSGCYFGVHFSPILFSLLPIYALWPAAESLLVSQSFLLALGGLPLYLLAVHHLRDKRTALGILAAYLLYVPLQGTNWFDFHPQIFIPLLFCSAHYFAIKESWKLYFLAVLLGLMIEEHLVYMIFLLALYYLMTSDVSGVVSSIRKTHSIIRPCVLWLRTKKVYVALLTMIVCVGWYLATKAIKNLFPVNPVFLDVYKATGTFQVLGFKDDILMLPVYAILNPLNVLNALAYDLHIKLLYFLMLFAPLLFFSFRSKFSILVLAILVPMLLTNYTPYYSTGAQYPLYLIPVVFLAAIEGLSSLGVRNGKEGLAVPSARAHPSNESGNGTHERRSIVKMMVAVSLIFAISASPLSPFAYKLSEKGLLWYPSPVHINPPDFTESLHALIGLIPSNAAVLTMNYIFPHVSSRDNAYLVPFDIAELHSGIQRDFMMNYVRQILNKTDYVLIDSFSSDYWTDFVREELSQSTFRIYATTYSFILFMKGYEGRPILVPNIDYQVFLADRDFAIPLGRVTSDRSSNTGYVAHSPKDGNNSVFIYGPHICLPSGTYNVEFEVKISNANGDQIAKLDVTDRYGSLVLTAKEISAHDVQTETWTNVTLSFSTASLGSSIEFRIFTSGLADVYFDRVILRVAT